MNNELLRFYKAEGSDAAGRTIDQVLGFDHEQLEKVHDYIQWLFPSPKASQYNPDAPLLDDETIAVFKADAEIMTRLRRSFALMLEFYGLELTQGDQAVGKGANYAQRKGNWQDAPAGYINHNLLRLTRILETLALLGLSDLSRALCQCLTQIQSEEPARIPAKTLAFWQQSAAIGS